MACSSLIDKRKKSPECRSRQPLRNRGIRLLNRPPRWHRIESGSHGDNQIYFPLSRVHFVDALKRCYSETTLFSI